MADSKINVKSEAKIVSNDKTKEQNEKLAQSKKQKEETIKKANELKAANEAKKQETNTTSVNSEEVVEFASKVINSSKKSSSFFKGLIVGALIGLALGLFVIPGLLNSAVDNAKDGADTIINENLLGYTAADFKEAILSKAIEKQELIVMEQPLEIETTITKAGLANLEIFSKVKNVTFAGKGVFTVDLSKISDETIEVDEERKTVTVYIPHTKLYDVIADLDNMKFEDTEKGLLAFGDISLTLEDQNELEKSVKQTMTNRLNQDEVLANADDFATMKTWEIFQPLVSAVSNEYVVEVAFK